jgi:hypothetical protein
MTDTVQRPVKLELRWRTLFKVLAAIALGWTLVQLLPVILIVIVAIVLAVSIDPIVVWLEHHRLPRTGVAVVVALVLVATFGGFLWLTWSSLASQWDQAAGQVAALVRDAWNRLPDGLRGALGSPQGGSASPADGFAVRVFSATTSAAGSILLGFVLTIYLLIEGRKTYAWTIACVPQRHRSRAERTAKESREGDLWLRDRQRDHIGDRVRGHVCGVVVSRGAGRAAAGAPRRTVGLRPGDRIRPVRDSSGRAGRHSLDHHRTAGRRLLCGLTTGSRPTFFRLGRTATA